MRLLEEYVCPLCRQREAVYYCGSCFLTFCSSCAKRRNAKYSICEKCGAVYYPDGEADPLDSCLSCGHDSFRVGVKKLVVCPRCMSEDVVDLARKREEQAARLRAVTSSLLSSSSLILNLINFASKAKSRLLDLRKKKFLHIPRLEEDILGVYEAISALKLKALSKAEIMVSGLVSRAASLVREWSPLRVKEIEMYFEQLEGALRDYRQLVEKECKSLEEKLGEISSILDYLEFHKKLFEEFRWLLDMEESEKPVCALPRVKYVGSSYLTSSKGVGTLFLTTKKVVFLKREGVVRRSFKKHFFLPLSEVELEVRRGLRRSFTLKTGKGTVSFTAPPQVLESVEDYFALAKNFDENSQSDRSLILKLEGATVGLSDFRRTIASLMESTLKFSEGSDKKAATPRQSHSPLPPPRPRPPLPPAARQEKLLELEKKKFSIKRNIMTLKELWDKGEVSLEDYLKMLRRLEGELYEVDVAIRKARGWQPQPTGLR
ncbi:MAG: hypothetical protein KIH01_08655 [Candidatus Freyarchaeota archaeon]|nr:hypothetical protein [Candidatus Jordarchaeia archaeon]